MSLMAPCLLAAKCFCPSSSEAPMWPPSLPQKYNLFLHDSCVASCVSCCPSLLTIGDHCCSSCIGSPSTKVKVLLTSTYLGKPRSPSLRDVRKLTGGFTGLNQVGRAAEMFFYKNWWIQLLLWSVLVFYQCIHASLARPAFSLLAHEAIAHAKLSKKTWKIYFRMKFVPLLVVR